MNIHEFIEEFRSVIVASVGRDSNPLYHPGTDRKKIYRAHKEPPQTAYCQPDRRHRRHRPGAPISRFSDSGWRNGLREDLYLHRRRSCFRIHKDSRRLPAASRWQVAAGGETDRAKCSCSGCPENSGSGRSAERETTLCCS